MGKLWIFCLFFAVITGCKPEVPDKENYFYLTFRFKDTSLSVPTAFKNIYGKSGNQVLPFVRTTDSTASLPLNFKSDNVTYFFESEESLDSLRLDYILMIEKNSSEYYARIDKIKVKSSFRNLKLNCNGNKSNCDNADSGNIIY